MKFFPGQYMDIAVPGTDQVRSFSMANTSSRDGTLEFVIKVYPDGLFSRFLDERLAVGDRLELTGPFGVFTLRDADTELLFVGGGAGMAPILSLLRTMAERGIQRKATFFYGARGERDLCFTEELAAIAEKLPNFTYIPALSVGMRRLAGRDRPHHRCRQAARGPARPARTRTCADRPRWSRRRSPCSTSLGVAEKRIYFDKFTTTGEPQ